MLKKIHVKTSATFWDIGWQICLMFVSKHAKQKNMLKIGLNFEKNATFKGKQLENV